MDIYKLNECVNEAREKTDKQAAHFLGYQMVGRPRGELAELENALGSLQKSDRNKPDVRASKRQVFQKMIGYVTIGMDMSSLMPKVISAANLSPDDLLLKKMMYLYLCTYAKQNPDLSLMAISQLQKDCKDTDPNVRGLALRSLCSLRVANLLEYVVSSLIRDPHQFNFRSNCYRFTPGKECSQLEDDYYP